MEHNITDAHSRKVDELECSHCGRMIEYDMDRWECPQCGLLIPHTAFHIEGGGKTIVEDGYNALTNAMDDEKGWSQLVRVNDDNGVCGVEQAGEEILIWYITATGAYSHHVIVNPDIVGVIDAMIEVADGMESVEI